MAVAGRPQRASFFTGVERARGARWHWRRAEALRWGCCPAEGRRAVTRAAHVSRERPVSNSPKGLIWKVQKNEACLPVSGIAACRHEAFTDVPRKRETDLLWFCENKPTTKLTAPGGCSARADWRSPKRSAAIRPRPSAAGAAARSCGGWSRADAFGRHINSGPQGGAAAPETSERGGGHGVAEPPSRPLLSAGWPLPAAVRHHARRRPASGRGRCSAASRRAPRAACPAPAEAGGSECHVRAAGLCAAAAAMGASQSVEIPGGGTEGYHVLRVREAGAGPGGRQAGGRRWASAPAPRPERPPGRAVPPGRGWGRRGEAPVRGAESPGRPAGGIGPRRRSRGRSWALSRAEGPGLACVVPRLGCSRAEGAAGGVPLLPLFPLKNAFNVPASGRAARRAAVRRSVTAADGSCGHRRLGAAGGARRSVAGQRCSCGPCPATQEGLAAVGSNCTALLHRSSACSKYFGRLCRRFCERPCASLCCSTGLALDEQNSRWVLSLDLKHGAVRELCQQLTAVCTSLCVCPMP